VWTPEDIAGNTLPVVRKARTAGEGAPERPNPIEEVKSQRKARHSMAKEHRPVEGIRIKPRMTVEDIVDQMQGTAFQARSLGNAAKVWSNMVSDHSTTIFLGLAGAMIPAGMRKVMCTIIQRKMADVVVSTGANLYHDIHESLGGSHWQGDASADDRALEKKMIDRIYDVFASEESFEETDGVIAEASAKMGPIRLTTRQYMLRLGRSLLPRFAREGMVGTAAKAGVPIFCPAIADSSLGIGLLLARKRHGGCPQLDLVADIDEITQMVQNSQNTGVLYIGGGTPKNYIQQTQVITKLLGKDKGGHKYAVQVTTDSPQWGGLSGCTLEESISWGKVSPRARTATVHADATIALPLLVAAVVSSSSDALRKRERRSFPYLSP